jgi:CrcB protein
VRWHPALAVVAGGLLGTGLRLALDAALPHADDAFPVSTLVANVVGSFALGLLVARVWPRSGDALKAFLGAGLLGSFTTYSAFAVSIVTLASRSEWALAVGYLVVSLALGLAAALLGLRIGRRAAVAHPTGETS